MDAESCLRRRIAQAVEADELPAQLLTDLDTAIAAMRAEPVSARREQTVQFLADVTDLPVATVEQALQAFERGGLQRQERLLQTLLDEWLEAQRRAYLRQRVSVGDL